MGASPRIAIVGAGALGGYIGALLQKAGCDVAFVARGARCDALRQRGLVVRTIAGDVAIPRPKVCESVDGLGKMDAVWFAVKLYDAEAALGLLAPLLSAHTVVVALQNGVEMGDVLRNVVGARRAALGVAYAMATTTSPGVITQTGPCRVVLGALSGDRQNRVEDVATWCRQAGIDILVSDSIEREAWAKFVHLSVLSGVTALTRAPVGIVRQQSALVGLCERAAVECHAVAQARSMIVEPLDAAESMRQVLFTLPAHAKSSMLVDLERERPLELPWLSGAVVRLGRDVGVTTPTHQFISAALAPYVNGRPSVGSQADDENRGGH